MISTDDGWRVRSAQNDEIAVRYFRPQSPDIHHHGDTSCQISCGAPALVIVGAMMSQNVGTIDWKDYTESIPAFLTMIGIPLSYSIADGLALGFIGYPIVKFLSGRGREAGWLTYLIAAVLVLYFVFVRSHL